MTDETVANARKSFDLKERLQGLGLRTGEITIYTDEVSGEELGYARDILSPNTLGIKVVVGRDRRGVLGQIDELDEKSETYAQDLERLSERRDELVTKIKESALTFGIRAVPPVIAKSHERQARKQLGINGKPSDEERSNVTEVQFALLFADTITSVVDADGADAGRLDYDAAKSLADYLPRAQLERLRDKVIDVQFNDMIDESVTSDADFSPAS